MKKILAIVLLVSFIIALAGCRKNADVTSSGVSSDSMQTVGENESLDDTSSIQSENSDSILTESSENANSVVNESSVNQTTSSKKEETVKSNEYNVIFDFGYGGNVITVQTKNHDVINVAPDIPSRPGYKFVAWYNGEQQLTYKNRIVNSDVTYVAEWTTPAYQMFYNFDPDGLLAAKGIYIIGLAVPYDSDKTNFGTINSPPHLQDKSMREYRISLPSTYDAETETFEIGPIVPEKVSYSDRILSQNPPTFGYLTEFEFIGWTYGDKTVPEKTVTIPKGSWGGYHFVAHWQPKNP